MKHLTLKTTLAALLFFSWGCATFIKKPAPKSNKTTVLFLVDGLGASSLNAALKQFPMPTLRHHFAIDTGEFQVARATFPTLTYPNITSILTSREVDQHPVIGNQVVINKRKIDFELPLNLALLNKTVEPFSVFQKLTSASFSYLFGQNATYHEAPKISSSLEYQFKEYTELDQKLIDSMVGFLQSRAPADWPRFIYIHLIGYDGHAHLYGPNSSKAMAYLSHLDSSLEKVFKILEAGDSAKHPVETILTADHGFVDAGSYIDIDKYVESFDQEIIASNEHRFVTIHKPSKISDDQLSKLLAPISNTAGVDIVAQRSKDSVVVKSPTQSFEIKYGPKLCPEYSYSLKLGDSEQFLCPDVFDQNAKGSEYPFLMTNLATYFNSPIRPDAVVFAKTGYGFTRKVKGNHGGLSKDEVLVPLLTRNISFGDRTNIIKTSELLLEIF